MTSPYLPYVSTVFPNFQPIACDQWSHPSNDYNCIAWAAEDPQQWWWPIGGTPFKPHYWPVGIPRTETIPAFVQAFETLGYSVCDNQDYEADYTKVALYALTSQTRKPKHMARQVSNGVWTSKLGPGPDVFHTTLECLEGPLYGAVALFLHRPKPR